MKTIVCSAMALVATAIPVAQAADAPTRQGFGISFGLGVGSANFDIEEVGSERESGTSGYLRLGGYVRPDLFVAFESDGYVDSADGVDTTGGFYSAALQWYPNVDKGFYLKGNLGVVGMVIEDDTDEIKMGALGVGLGLGYDFRLGRNFSLTPFVNIFVSGKGDLKLNGESTGLDGKVNVSQIGLGFTWH